MEKYDKGIKEQLALGIIEEAPEKHEGLEHYLPHQAVIRMDKVSTKLRIVYDASAKIKGRCSLNECLFRGPVILPDLAGMLIRVRLPRIVILADIEKAFLMISLEEGDRNVVKFLWVRDPSLPLTSSNLVAYRFKRVAFGVISSPFLLGATVRHHLSKYQTPLATEMAANSYVDNIMMSAESVDEAMQKYHESKMIFSEAKMNLREYISNREEVNQAIPEADRLNKEFAKVLGIPWDLARDVLTLKLIEKPESPIVPTRRSILQDMGRIYDPLGLITPCVLDAKKFFQGLWNKQHSWDAQLSPTEEREWIRIRNAWGGYKFSFPRRVVPSNCQSTQIHVFVDASKAVYAATVYLRCENSDRVETHLIFSKNRLKPKKEISIPRMELLALYIGAKALNFVKRELRMEHAVEYMWSDSQAALHWIAASEDQSVFVKNRLKVIRQLKSCRFSHVPGSENPADLSTRGCSPEALDQNSLWRHGPGWLKQPKCHWPSVLIITPPPEGQEEAESISAVENPSWIDPAERAIDKEKGWTMAAINTETVTQNKGVDRRSTDQ
jgi:hypothetical protein